MNRINYQKEMEKELKLAQDAARAPSLLLHSCCAPCSSYVLEYLSKYFRIYLLYYNPNISPESEYNKRLEEQYRLISELNTELAGNNIAIMESRYNPEAFYIAAKGLENEPEQGRRCTECYKLRLEEAANEAKRSGMDYFTTTLTISPLKNADEINRIGAELEKRYGVRYLFSDFKKRNGYKRSIELSKEYGLYRQNYCGCVFSRREK